MALSDKPFVYCAFSDVFLIVPEISSIVAAVCSNVLAWFSTSLEPVQDLRQHLITTGYFTRGIRDAANSLT